MTRKISFVHPQLPTEEPQDQEEEEDPSWLRRLRDDLSLVVGLWEE